MKTIITIQHTQSVHHTNGMIGSWTEWDLTDLGKRQAETIGKNLAVFVGTQPFAMHSSDQRRARQTAEIVGRHLGIEPILDARLREQNLGEAIGKSAQWARENTIVRMKTVDDRAFRGAETHRDTWNRVLPFVQSVLGGGEENLLVVSHGVTLGILHAIWLGWQVEDLNRAGLFGAAGGVSVLQEEEDGKRIVRRLGDLSFMKE